VRGAALLGDARRALRLVDDALNAARDAVRVRPAGLTIGWLPYGVDLLYGLFAALRDRHPDLVVDGRGRTFATQLRDLRSGELDVELLTYVPDDPELVVQPLLHSPAVVFMSAQHRLAGRERLSFADIADETWPGRHPAVSEEWADVYWLTARRGRRPRVTEQTPLSADECWALMVGGEVIITCPEHLADQMLGPATGSRLGLVSIALDDVEPFVLALACRRDCQNPLAHELLALAADVAR